MLERELEVLDQTIDATGEVAVELANLRDAIGGLSADEIKQGITAMIERVDSVADVLTALSVDLAKVNNALAGARKPESHEETPN